MKSATARRARLTAHECHIARALLTLSRPTSLGRRLRPSEVPRPQQQRRPCSRATCTTDFGKAIAAASAMLSPRRLQHARTTLASCARRHARRQPPTDPHLPHQPRVVVVLKVAVPAVDTDSLLRGQACWLTATPWRMRSLVGSEGRCTPFGHSSRFNKYSKMRDRIDEASSTFLGRHNGSGAGRGYGTSAIRGAMRRRSGTVLDQETLAKLNESGANEIAAALVQQMWRRREVVRNASGSSQGGCTRAPRLQARCEARAKGLVGVVASEFAPAAPRFLRWIVVNTTRRPLDLRARMTTRGESRQRGWFRGWMHTLSSSAGTHGRWLRAGPPAEARVGTREGDGGSSSGDSCGAARPSARP